MAHLLSHSFFYADFYIMPDLRFKKFERLKSRKSIGYLFEKGKSFSCYPLLVKYSFFEVSEPGTLLRCAFTVPRRTFRHAVDRNRIKRQMREAFRLQKHLFYQGEKELQLNVMFIYTARKTSDYEIIAKATLELIGRLSNLDLPTDKK